MPAPFHWADRRPCRGRRIGSENGSHQSAVAATNIDDVPELGEVIGRNQQLGNPPGVFGHSRVEDGSLLWLGGEIFEAADAEERDACRIRRFSRCEAALPRIPGTLAAEHQGDVPHRTGHIRPELFLQLSRQSARILEFFDQADACEKRATGEAERCRIDSCARASAVFASAEADQRCGAWPHMIHACRHVAGDQRPQASRRSGPAFRADIVHPPQCFRGRAAVSALSCSSIRSAHLGALSSIARQTARYQDADLNAGRLQPRTISDLLPTAATSSAILSEAVGSRVRRRSHDAVESSSGKSGFYRGRHIRRDRRTLPVGDHQQPCLAAWDRRQHDGRRRHHT